MKPLVLALVAMVAAASPAHADIQVYAPPTLTEVLTDSAAAFAAQGHSPVNLVFSHTPGLVVQIQNGAPADLFLSADPHWMQVLVDDGGVVADSVVPVAANGLVLVGAVEEGAKGWGSNPIQALPDKLVDGNRLAVCDPDSHPAGMAAKAALDKLGLWSRVESKVVRLDNVRAAIALVERGEAKAGIVFRTDARLSDRVRVLADFPLDLLPPIIMPAAVVTGHDSAEARAFLAFLLSRRGQDIFAKYGFLPPPHPTGSP